ncbi:transposase, partial [Pseudomonas viridiflava]|uniref:transposase n=1 Tax=Pseudomonas viridiflava TaxID=33069 RepID=UPI0013CF0C18
YWSSKCQGCALKTQCTPSKQRRVRRWEHEAILEEMQVRPSNAPDMMRIRKRKVEHPFGTLKQWMGATHFFFFFLEGVSAEMNLIVLAYNMNWVMKILGTNNLMKA